MESRALSQADTVIASDDQAKKYVRWKDEEEKAICELLKSQWQAEKANNSDTLNGTKFWPLISERLRKTGIDKTPVQCSRYWYAWARHRPEFKDTLQFQSKNNSPGAPMSNTGTDNIQGAQPLGVQTRSGSNTPASISKSRTDNIPSTIFNAGFDNLPATTISNTETDNTSASMSQVETGNSEGFSRWTEDETQKLSEVVLAYRSSTLKDQQKGSEAFWTLISKKLETHHIHRTWSACRRRFTRARSTQVSPAKQDINSHDGRLPSLYNKSDIDEEGDTSCIEEEQDAPSPRRGDRKRMSRPPWTDEEHNRLVQLLKAQRELEDRDQNLEKLSNNQLFTLVSKQLKGYLIEKSVGACTLYWRNKGYLRSGFDINSPALLQQRRESSESSILPASSPVGKDIADAFSKLPQQHFDDSSTVKGFRTENLVRSNKRPRGASDAIWEVDDSDDEQIVPAKRRRYAGDVLGNKEDIKTLTPAEPSLGSAPGMVKRRAPKRDPSLPLFKPSGRDTSSTESNSAPLNLFGEPGQSAESMMKRKIQDLQGRISSLGMKKQKAMSEVKGNESEILSINNEIELWQVRKKQLQQSKREKEAQIDVYSSHIKDLASKRKTLEDALDIVRARF